MLLTIEARSHRLCLYLSIVSKKPSITDGFFLCKGTTMYKIGGFTVYGEHEEDPGGLSIMLRPYAPTYPWWSEATANVLTAMHDMPIEGASVLDFGCAGSVILGLAAKKLGAREVVAVENDPRAIEQARMQVKGRGIKVMESTDKTFDIILANVGDAELVGQISIHSKRGVGTDIDGNLLPWEN